MLSYDIILKDGIIKALSETPPARITRIGARKKYDYTLRFVTTIGKDLYMVQLFVRTLKELDRNLIFNLALAYMNGKYPGLSPREKVQELIQVLPADNTLFLRKNRGESDEDIVKKFTETKKAPAMFTGRVNVEFRNAYYESCSSDMISWRVCFKQRSDGEPLKYTVYNAPLLEMIQENFERAFEDSRADFMG